MFLNFFTDSETTPKTFRELLLCGTLYYKCYHVIRCLTGVRWYVLEKSVKRVYSEINCCNACVMSSTYCTLILVIEIVAQISATETFSESQFVQINILKSDRVVLTSCYSSTNGWQRVTDGTTPQQHQYMCTAYMCTGVFGLCHGFALVVERELYLVFLG
jgi:hypothetical protein